MLRKRKTTDVDHTGTGGMVRVPLDESERGYVSIAEYAAGILARREYGRSGTVRTCRIDSWTTDGLCGTYEAFIGRPVQGGGIQGYNVWIYVDSRD